jgi:Family of unknown function (DUF6352)
MGRHFWASSGHVLLEHDAGGGLLVTDEYLKAYLARKELIPPDDACDTERDLHARLLADPRAAVAAGTIAAIADPDARENWTFLLAFRDRLVEAPTLEAAYMALTRDGWKGVPPLFMLQMAHVILRNALDDCDDPFVVRAAECFYRSQRVTVQDGTILLADSDIVELHEEERHASPLLSMMGEAASRKLDILKSANADGYWQRSDAFDMVLDLGGQPSGRSALADALAIWVRHLHGIAVAIEPVERIEDADWRWFVGLDADATRIGNALWSGKQVEPDAMARIIGLFRLTFPAGAPVLPQAAGRPVYLLMAMTEDRHLRLKPHNLVTGLPLAASN